jgi:predicted GH43/DUF377 family glycosyl hydrolase
MGSELIHIVLIFLFVVFLLGIFWAKTSRTRERRIIKHTLRRAPKNPLLEPRDEYHWESDAVFNPAAVYDKGKVHLFYRALGKDGVSRIGYASSKDGVHFGERLPYPVYAHSTPWAGKPHPLMRYDPQLYESGGGWGGTEDPRIVKIDNRFYLTFSAFNGWDSMRMGMISIDEEDFYQGRFHWSRPTFLSPKGEVHKNWVLFPQKVGGKFAILTSITPHIQIEYYDSIADFSTKAQQIKSIHAQESLAPERWESHIRGVGPPPIHTSEGWITLYHAMDKHDPDRYKIGAMLLDRDDPSKIISRTKHPILAPDHWYENHGKPGVVYACGAVVKDALLRVYYGGADRVVCTGSISLQKLISMLLNPLTSHR